MKHDRRFVMAIVVAIVGAVAFVWLLTLDVYDSERGVDGATAFCRSAYDVAHGYIGGEIPDNEGAIDRTCVKEARTDVGLAVLAALTALGGFAYALRRYDPQPRQREGEALQEKAAPAH